MILKKTVFFCFFTFVLSFSFSETLSSSPLLRGISPSLQPEVKKLLEKENVHTLVSSLDTLLQKATLTTDKEILSCFGASLYKLMGDFPKASLWYEKTAQFASEEKGISYILASVQCSLTEGNTTKADTLLKSVSKKTVSQLQKNLIKVYALWSWIYKTEKTEDLYEPLVILESYTSVESMKDMHPSLLLILFSLTQKDAYKESLLKKFPNSPEALIIKEKAQFLPGPFWYLY
ncbi:MAG: hypothetical protein E7062_00940 [Spirochaetaceae bacterium]|nr:hypothetical protein [Spirochaetaceae bacterium]